MLHYVFDGLPMYVNTVAPRYDGEVINLPEGLDSKEWEWLMESVRSLVFRAGEPDVCTADLAEFEERCPTTADFVRSLWDGDTESKVYLWREKVGAAIVGHLVQTLHLGESEFYGDVVGDRPYLELSFAGIREDLRREELLSILLGNANDAARNLAERFGGELLQVMNLHPTLNRGWLEAKCLERGFESAGERQGYPRFSRMMKVLSSD
jgi:hypothetical protein